MDPRNPDSSDELDLPDPAELLDALDYFDGLDSSDDEVAWELARRRRDQDRLENLVDDSIG